jgi:hypothetical protein
MENPNGEEILAGEISFTGIPAGIYNGIGEEVASVGSESGSTWSVDHYKCSLHIQDLAFNRKIMLGFWMMMFVMVPRDFGSVV